MSGRGDTVFPTVRTEGGLLPSELLLRVVEGDGELRGLSPRAYHLAGGERLNEVISRSWSRLQGAWENLREALAKLPESDLGTSITRERWLLILFEELAYGRLQASRAVEIDAKSYPISHFWQKTPIHLVGIRTDLDRRTPGVPGAARMSPHGMVQELLNRSEDHLWGFVSNGRRLRILRDHASLTRQAYVEFDLEGMMEGEVYADFVLLWLLCHESRVEPVDGRPDECWLERWAQRAREDGTRALDRLRDGVERAIEALGAGFLAHPRNTKLRDSLRTGGLSTQDYYREVLRLVYRLLFLFVAEDRELLLDPHADPAAKERYRRHYSTARLRRVARSHRGTKHPDLYRGLRIVMEGLGRDEDCPALGLCPLGSFLWSKDSLPNVGEAEIANRDFLDAIRRLSLTVDAGVARPVDYRHLGAEELGSVYESLLELHPTVDAGAGAFSLSVGGGHERRTTGSYYTPTSLVECLLDSALDPVLDEALRAEEPEEALLSLKICDPAVGSGHFLIAAAHQIARRLAFVRTGIEEPSPEATREALRDVIGHCLYGVDVNPMAVELCKVSLWMEALEPGKPLSFLGHRILCGNSLLGTTPALLAKGIPDDAFQPIEGDDREIARELKKQNREECQSRQIGLKLVAERRLPFGELRDQVLGIDEIDDASIAGVHRKEERFRRHIQSAEYRHAQLMADAWCATFVWPKRAGAAHAITHDVFRRLEQDQDALTTDTKAEVDQLAEEYRFFHWHLAFPDVFRVPVDGVPGNELAGWSGGFDVVLGNPPWERIKLQEKEWFANRSPEIANAPNASARARKIKALKNEDPALYAQFLEARRRAEGASHLVRDSGRYPLCGRGDINTYSIFAETNRMILGPNGRVGCIVPSGIATDHTTQFFFQDLMESKSLVSLYDFENRKGIFPSIHRSYKFCLLTLTGSRRPVEEAEFVFFAHRIADLADEERRFTLSTEEIELLNPNTRTCPIFRSRRDAEITKAIYRRVLVLIREGPPEENPWGVSFTAMFHMANDSGLFRTRDQLEADGWRLEGNVFRRGEGIYLPLYEGKMIHQFDHRFGDYADLPPGSKSTQLPEVPVERKRDPSYAPLPRYWVPQEEVEARLEGWPHGFLMGWRRNSRSTDERTFIANALPRVGVGDSLFLFLNSELPHGALLANTATFAFDFLLRQKLGGTNNSFYIVMQLPVIPPTGYYATCPWTHDQTLWDWIRPRFLELVYTAADLESFANEMGHEGPPFMWDEERRFLLRCELDAAYFHLYGINRDDAAYILDTFPIVKEKDEHAFGDYRMKRVILETYEELAKAIVTGKPYATRLDPPPADPRLLRGSASEQAITTRPAPTTPSLKRVRPRPEDKYTTCVPLLSVKAAAGTFSEDQLPEFEDWVEIETSRRLQKGMFVARVEGRSMEPLIPNGCFALFRYPVLNLRDGMVILAQHHDIDDPETGGAYTVKRFRRSTASSKGGDKGFAIRLEPENSEYPPILIRSNRRDEFRAIAEFLEVVS